MSHVSTQPNALPHSACTTRKGTSPLSYLQSRLNLSRSRRALLSLSEAQLQDIGLTSAQARAEAKRPAWDIPANWCK